MVGSVLAFLKYMYWHTWIVHMASYGPTSGFLINIVSQYFHSWGFLEYHGYDERIETKNLFRIECIYLVVWGVAFWQMLILADKEGRVFFANADIGLLKINLRFRIGPPEWYIWFCMVPHQASHSILSHKIYTVRYFWSTVAIMKEKQQQKCCKYNIFSW